MVNCSLFNPTPSLSAMIVNHFKMRGDVISYNLAGMGCSAGVIAIGLAQRLLMTEPGKYALVVSTENITQVRTALAACELYRIWRFCLILTAISRVLRKAIPPVLQHVLQTVRLCPRWVHPGVYACEGLHFWVLCVEAVQC